MEQPIGELILYTYPWQGVGIGKNVTKCYMGRSSFRCTNFLIPGSCIMHGEPLTVNSNSEYFTYIVALNNKLR